MQAAPITEDQESTLRLWVSKVGKRPGKRAKAFLQAVNGLSKSQVDQWFEDFVNEHDPRKFQEPEKIPERMDSDPQPYLQDIDMTMGNPSGAPRDEVSFDGLNFDSFGLDYFSSDAPELQIWSPIDIGQDSLSNNMQFMFDAPEKSSPWSPSMATQGCFPHPATMSSTSELSPLLSSQQDFSSLSDKSSLRTWDTASTLVSTTQNKTMDGMKDCEYELEEEAYIASAALIRFVPPPPAATPKTKLLESIKEDEDFQAPKVGKLDLQLPSIAYSPPEFSMHFSSNARLPSLPTSASRATSTRSPETSYKCTSCDSHFTRKGDWKRHEEGHDPPILWTCMLGETLHYSRSEWKCVFCSSLKKSHEEMKQHLTDHHRVFKCANKKPCFSRKDKLKQHLLQVHALEGGVSWESWSQPARKKWAWGCGYCGVCLFTWDGRMIHLADHYEKQPSCIPRWSRSLVVRGLLKQARPDFNINQVWKSLVGDALTGDGAVEWSRESAISLKHRLEYRSETPQQLAREAFRLAHFTKSQSRGGCLSQASVTAIPPSMSLDVEPESGSPPLKSKFAVCSTSPSVTMKDVVMIQDTNFF